MILSPLRVLTQILGARSLRAHKLRFCPSKIESEMDLIDQVHESGINILFKLITRL